MSIHLLDICNCNFLDDVLDGFTDKLSSIRVCSEMGENSPHTIVYYG